MLTIPKMLRIALDDRDMRDVQIIIDHLSLNTQGQVSPTIVLRFCIRVAAKVIRYGLLESLEE